MTIFGTPGNDRLAGTADDDTFDLSQGGNDKVQGLGGDDTFVLGAAFNNNDSLDGGDGNDTLSLNGDYSRTIAFKADTVANLENITVGAGFDYSLRMNEASLQLGQTMTVDATALGAGNHLRFDASAGFDVGDYVIKGGAGDDWIFGGNNADTVTPGSGNDTVEGFDGNDRILFGGNFTGQDRVDGGGNNDVVVLDGDYSAGVVFRSTTLNAGTLQLDAGHDYKLLGHGHFNFGLTIDASALGAGDTVEVDTGDENNNSPFTYLGSAGRDVFIGGSTGFNTVEFAPGTFSVDDRVSNAAIMQVSGNYGLLVFHAPTLHNVQELQLGVGFDYDLRLGDANVSAGKTLDVFYSLTDGNDRLHFDGSRETDGHYSVSGGGGNNVIIGGHLSDTLNGSAANDTIDGGAGDDHIGAGAGVDNISGGAGNDTIDVQLSKTDVINGGSGSDTITMFAFTPTTVHFEATTIHSVEAIDVTNDSSGVISFTLDAANVAAGHTLSITGVQDVDGSAVAGDLDITGAGNFTGGSGDDTFALTSPGGTETGNAGDDRFVFDDHYLALLIGAGANYTTISGFDPTVDHIDLPVAVSGIDTEVTTGALSTATFTSDLETAIGSSQLAAGHAVLFKPSSGDLAGQLFLIVDQNGQAGFQNAGADADLYVHLTSGLNLGSLAASTFEVIPS